MEATENKKKIKCENCGRVIATGQLPAPVEIKCPHCNVLNDLANTNSRLKPFSDRIDLEKKGTPFQKAFYGAVNSAMKKAGQ